MLNIVRFASFYQVLASSYQIKSNYIESIKREQLINSSQLSFMTKVDPN